MANNSWGVVIPVKRLVVAKSRLQVLGDPLRTELALAFAEDVVRAALGCPQVTAVLIVTDDPRAAQVLGEQGAEVVADGPDAGHNAAVQHAASLLNPTLGVVALSSDLPALTAADLTDVLTQLPPGARGFVADAEGTGTTLLAAGSGLLLRPAYGVSSRREHLRSGAIELSASARLRRDVDTPEDLAQALGLGVGPATTQALRRHRP